MDSVWIINTVRNFWLSLDTTLKPSVRGEALMLKTGWVRAWDLRGKRAKVKVGAVTRTGLSDSHLPITSTLV